MSSTKDFFISYNRNDQGWAAWIADVLEKASRSVIIQAWDFLPGSNFVVEMQRATSECDKAVAILSPDYLASMFTQAEWAVAFSVDPSGANRKLIPIRVRMCEPPGLLRTIVYCDLLGLAEDAAKSAVLRAVSTDRVRPERPIFPSPKLETSSPPLLDPPVPSDTSYPGPGSQVSLKRVPESVSAAAELLSLVRTTRTTFEAQSRLRDLALGFEARHPAHGAGDADPKTLGCRVARHLTKGPPGTHETVHNLGGATDRPGRGGSGERDEVADPRGTGRSGRQRPVP